MSDSASPITRRAFLADSAAATAAVLITPALASAAENAPQFYSQWQNTHDRVWIGPDYWANPMQDWRVAGGRISCIKAAAERTVHVLTRDLSDQPGTLEMRVRIGRVEGGKIADSKAAAGFSVGVKGPLKEYRHNLVHGSGLNIGFRASGELFIGDGPQGKTAPATLAVDAVDLELKAECDASGCKVRLSAHDASNGRLLGEVERSGISPEMFTGNLALAANFGKAPGAWAQQRVPTPADRWWFADWHITGTKVRARDEHRFGPLLFNQYAIHQSTLKMTVQLPPLGEQDDREVRLEFQRDGRWQPAATAMMEPGSRIALFRVAEWKSDAEVRYRIALKLRAKDGATHEDVLEGVIRREPKADEVLTVADISCNAHYAFPNTACAAAIAKLNPDLLAFTGDQYYESSGGFGVDRSGVENSILDVLRKWMLHGWTWRELMRDRPTVCIPDDHDVYHGNLWGDEGGHTAGNGPEAEGRGGYKMSTEFVNAVHRMQTAHHPDSPAKPGKHGVTGYYGPLTYGGVSFAILADRQYKSGPAGKVPPTTSGRPDHVDDPNFNPKSADLPGLELLGGPQLEFLRGWVNDWKGAEMKAVISQTLFTAMATHHGKKSGLLIADYDTNAWPQSARNAAVREMRRAFAFHIAGDQHLPAVVQYGVDSHRDGVVAFASPAVNNLYPRWFLPPNSDKTVGNFVDSFGHPVTVLACANPQQEFRKGLLEAEMDKSSGYGVVRFDKRAKTIVVECWPLLADPTKPGTQFPGWPVTVAQTDNYALTAVAHLPKVKVRGTANPVIQIIEERTGEMLYTLRLPAGDWRAPVFAPGSYTIRAVDSESGKSAEKKGIVASKESAQPVELAI